MKINPLMIRDWYKFSHIRFYPEKTTRVYSNLTPRRSCRGLNNIVFFGLQGFIKEYLIESFQENFFDRDINELVAEYKDWLGEVYLEEDLQGMINLHKLGYLPIKIKALPEGSSVAHGVPVLTIHNTHEDFFWLTNALETLISCELWHNSTAATTAREYLRVFTEYADITCDNNCLVPFQGHSFQARGSQGLSGLLSAGSGHLTCFLGTDDVPAIGYLKRYYCPSSLVGTSVPASEHAVMCAGTKEGEFDTFKSIITDKFPKGVVSIVSDTWSLKTVVVDYLQRLKDVIINREGTTIIRPDSGCPVKIICGDPDSKDDFYQKGVIESLWDIFGGTINEKGYKVLDSHIGCIYGDSITLNRQRQILDKLKEKGFASSNILLGIGSYAYTYVIRDVENFAIKATAVKVNNEDRPIFKQPETDDGTKNSAKGYLRVNGTNGNYTLEENVSWEREGGCLETVFEDGKLIKETSLEEIRTRVKETL